MTHVTPIPTDAFSILTQPGAPIVAKLAVKFAVCVTTWATRRRTRLALTQLASWQLADVGLTPDEAYIESRRVFWRA